MKKKEGWSHYFSSRVKSSRGNLFAMVEDGESKNTKTTGGDRDGLEVLCYIVPEEGNGGGNCNFLVEAEIKVREKDMTGRSNLNGSQEMFKDF